MLSVFRRSELEHHMCSVSGSGEWWWGRGREGSIISHVLRTRKLRILNSAHHIPSHPATLALSRCDTVMSSWEARLSELTCSETISSQGTYMYLKTKPYKYNKYRIHNKINWEGTSIIWEINHLLMIVNEQLTSMWAVTKNDYDIWNNDK